MRSRAVTSGAMRWSAMRPMVLILVAALATTISWSLASTGAVGDATEDVTPANVSGRVGGTWHTFRSTTHGGTTYRVSGRGNVFSAESPTGIDHIDTGTPIEGYCIRYTPPSGIATEAYDVASSQFGFGKATRSRSAPWLVTRTTSDGKLRLTQEFTFDALAKELQIEMTFENVSRKPISNILVTRKVDFDIDVGGSAGFANAADNWVAVTDQSAMAWSDTSYTVPHGMLLQPLRTPSASSPGSAHFDNTPTTCFAGLFRQAPHRADDAQGIHTNLEDLQRGEKRSVTFRYTRY